VPVNGYIRIAEAGNTVDFEFTVLPRNIVRVPAGGPFGASAGTLDYN